MVNQQRLGEPTPVFRNPQVESYDAEPAEPEQNVFSPVTPSSRFTTSSVGTIPEFPAPGDAAATPAMPPPPRKSINLGPPPSRRLAASSYYSTASNVSPIAEESNRSHGSYASSAAIPGHWSPASPLASNPDSFYDDSLTEASRDSIGDDYADDRTLVRSASIGQKAKPSLVVNRPSGSAKPPSRQAQEPFQAGTGYVDGSSSSSNAATPAATTPAATPAATSDGRPPQPSRHFFIPVGIDDPSSDLEKQDTNMSSANLSATDATPTQSNGSNRRSGLKRPPRLDMDAVKAAEARGSLTSLPDLIKRATRLAAMIEGGKRPASRVDVLNDFLDKSDSNGSKDEIGEYSGPAGRGPGR